MEGLSGLSAVYSTHPPAKIVTQAFARGAKCPWIPAKDYKEGPVAIYGLARGLFDVWNIAKKHTCIRIDHGYINPGHYDGYYAVTKDVIQHTGEGDYDAKRLDPIRPELKPMRHGEHILLLPPSRLLAPYIGLDVDDWIETYKKIPTDRPIRVREKFNDRTGEGSTTPLEEDLKDCHAVVTFNSKVSIRACCEGISVFVSDPCCATRIAQPMFTIDNPDLNIDREGWLRALSYNQFTLDEMRKGALWDWATRY
jgi:hypothetical protein